MSKKRKIKSRSPTQNKVSDKIKYGWSTSPNLSFKFMYGIKVGDFQMVSKLENKNHKKYFEELQRFIYDFDNERDLSEAIKHYTSHKGSKIGLETPYVKQIMSSFEKNHKEYFQFFPHDELIHLHTKRQGKGKFVLFGVRYDDTFYVLAMNPNHDF